MDPSSDDKDMLQSRLGSLWVALVAVVLLAGYFLTPTTRTLIHFVVSQAHHGVSSGKIVYALVFLIAFSAVSALRRGTREGVSLGIDLLHGVIATGLVLSLVAHLLYAWDLGLPANARTYHWKDGFGSFNAAWHIHTSKGALAMALDALGLSQLAQHFDIGLAYVDQADPAFFIGIGMSFVAALVLSMTAGTHAVARYPAHERPLVALLLGMALATLCKSVLDGGLLAYDTFVAWIVVAILTRTKRLGRIPAFFAGRGAWLVVTLPAWLALLCIVSPGSLAFAVTNLLYRASIYFAILCTAAITLPVLRGTWSLVGATLSWTVIAWFGTHAALDKLMPVFEPAPDRVIEYVAETGVDHDRQNAGVTLVARTVKVGAGHSYLDVYERLGEIANRVRWVSAAPDRGRGPRVVLRVELIFVGRTEVPTFGTSAILSLRDVEIATRTDPRIPPRVRIAVEFDRKVGPVLHVGDGSNQIDDNERHVGYRILDHYLRANGVTEYVLIPRGILLIEDDPRGSGLDMGPLARARSRWIGEDHACSETCGH